MALSLFAKLVIAGLSTPGLCSSSAANQAEHYAVFLDTTAVQGHPGAVDFVLLSPRSLDNNVEIDDFRHDGVASSRISSTGLTSGDITDGRHLSDERLATRTHLATDEGEFYAGLWVPFSEFGSYVSFSFRMASTWVPPDSNLPDEFAFYLLDASGNPIFSCAEDLGAGSVFAVSITGFPGGYPEVFAPAAFPGSGAMENPHGSRGGQVYRRELIGLRTPGLGTGRLLRERPLKCLSPW